jgi:uncharacterized protein YjhX (UPF0386 family)
LRPNFSPYQDNSHDFPKHAATQTWLLCAVVPFQTTETAMNISRFERRILDMLAKGGRIEPEKDEKGKIIDVDFISREGWFLDGTDLQTFKRLRAKKLIASFNGSAYRISKQGIASLQIARNA